MEVQCVFGDEKWYSGDVIREMYTCRMDEVTITEPRTEIAAFIGCHLAGRSNNDVKAIISVKTTIHYFPHGLSKIFPNLEFLEIRGCSLIAITREDLFGLENLEDLNLQGNELHTLPSDLFAGMTKLKEISLSRNKLEFLSSDLLKAIAGNGLSYVDFERNSKINAFYKSGNEESVGSLQELMDFIDEKCESPRDKEKEKFMNIFAGSFQNLWLSKDFSDFIVIGGGEEESKEFAVHKILLATHSEVFATMLKNNMKETQEGKIFIDDFSAETVEAMLEFMYTGKVQEMNAMDLFAIAAMYEVQLLKERAEKLILQNLNDTNALEIFGLGYLHKSERIKRKTFKFIKRMFPQTPLSGELMEQPESLREIIEVHREHLEVQAKLNETLEKFKKLNK